jgi:hypothetical protein
VKRSHQEEAYGDAVAAASAQRRILGKVFQESAGVGHL